MILDIIAVYFRLLGVYSPGRFVALAILFGKNRYTDNRPRFWMLDTGCLLERSGNPDLSGILNYRGLLSI